MANKKEEALNLIKEIRGMGELVRDFPSLYNDDERMYILLNNVDSLEDVIIGIAECQCPSED